VTDYTTNAHCEFAKVAATDLRNRLCNRCGNQLTRLPGHDNVVRLLVTLSNVGCRVLRLSFSFLSRNKQFSYFLSYYMIKLSHLVRCISSTGADLGMGGRGSHN